jgi:general secretion pathway protein G
MSSKSNRHRRGITVIELAALLALVAVVLGGALLLVRPSIEADKADAAMRDAMQIREAALEWKDEQGALGCPTLSQLMQDKRLTRDARTDDPWGGRFRIECGSAEVVVVSAGRDGKLGTDDDIRVPHKRS